MWNSTYILLAIGILYFLLVSNKTYYKIVGYIELSNVLIF